MPGSRASRSTSSSRFFSSWRTWLWKLSTPASVSPGTSRRAGEQHVEARLVVAVAEVVEAGVGDRLATQRVGVELAGGPHRRHRLEDLDDLGRELRFGQVVDVDVGHQVPLVPPRRRGGCATGRE